MPMQIIVASLHTDIKFVLPEIIKLIPIPITQYKKPDVIYYIWNDMTWYEFSENVLLIWIYHI